MEADIEADFSGREPRYRLHAAIAQLYYGPLLKSIDPGSEDDGTLSLKLDLAGHGPWREVKSTLEGGLALIVFPRGARARLLDLWGGGLLRAFLSHIEEGAETSLNCVAVSFDIAQGKAKTTALMVDSKRTRAAGEIEINLDGGALKGSMASKSKRAELFSSWLPVVLGGTLADPSITVNPVRFAVTAGRYFLLLESFLFDTITSENVPEDGRDDCVRIYRSAAN